MPQRQCGYRVGNPPYAATSFISSGLSTSKTCGKKSRPLRRANASIFSCQSRRYPGSATRRPLASIYRPFPRNSLMEPMIASLSRISEVTTRSSLPRCSRRSFTNWPEP